MALPEEEVRDLLQAGGLLDGWTDSRGGTQPAPKVQIGMFREAELEPSERCVLIRKNGGTGGDEFLRNPGIAVYLFGYTSDAHLLVAERIGQMIEYVLDNYKSGRTIGMNTTSDIEGPYILDSGRPAYEFNLQNIIAR